MNHHLHHRGPDASGELLNDDIALAMRRLSIIDLETGQQPICNENGRLRLIFNGEIYNHHTLRTILEQKGHQFRSHSDSEVIIHAYEEFGADCLHQFNGMFAFAIWDQDVQELFLARDRLGIKPLYYTVNQGQLIFASELTALLHHPHTPREINPAAIDHFLTYEYIPAPLSILSGVHKLLPGHFLRFRDGRYTLTEYWNLRTNSGRLPRLPTAADYMARLDELLADAVKTRLMSDVPLGAFLSGGIDSSTVVAHMAAATDAVRTFSVGFDDQSYNELPFAEQVAAHFGTEHHQEILHPEILPLAEQLLAHLDEPLGDFSIFPTFLVSQMAGQTVKVILSGDGGDELFAGYDTYVAERMARVYGRLPNLLTQRLIPAAAAYLPPQPAKKGVINKIKRFTEGAALPAERQHTRWMTFLSAAGKQSLYHNTFLTEITAQDTLDRVANTFTAAQGLSPLQQQQFVDIKTYLVDNILTKVDRMSMAASVEVRVPLLDHRIVEFALAVPDHLKMDRRETKILLRRVAAQRLPAAILNKPKQGFSIPIKQWLGSTLRPLLEDALSADRIRRRGYFSPETITRWKQEHINGRANHSHRLWTLIVFEMWLRHNIDK